MEEQNPQALSPTTARAPAIRDVIVQEEELRPFHHLAERSLTLRDVTAVIFRHRALLISSFVTVFLGVVLGTWMMPKLYEAQMKILVKRERPDPIVTSDASIQSMMVRDVTPEDLNSEVELLKSRDLLEKVVVSCGLQNLERPSFLGRFLGSAKSKDPGSAGPDMQIAAAVRSLERALDVELIAKSKLIGVRYTSPDPQLAARVLQALSSGYLEKHLSVHRPPGALDFFQQQAAQYHQGLTAAEKNLSEFSRKQDVVSIDLEKDIALRKLSDFERQLRETQASQAAVAERIKSLEAQAAETPPRVVTQVRTSDNAALLEKLKTTLLGLEMKRTELLTKYEPSHRAVQEIDTQIAQARDALAQAEKRGIRDETTDLDKTRQWLDEELARARAEQATLRARSEELSKSVEAYRESARGISRKEMQQEDLRRTAKTAEENYLLYLRKQEEARISDALDRKQIVNVAIAEAATMPAFPSSPRWGLNLTLGLMLALLMSLALTFAVDHMDPSFRTPDEVERQLGIPVLAAMPRAHWGIESGHDSDGSRGHDSRLLQAQ